MAATEIRIEVTTPERRVLWDRAKSIIVPGADGYLGILAHHAPMVAGLRAGVVFYGEESGEKRRLAITGGFLEVIDNHVTILADAGELAEEIDVDRAKAAFQRAERRLRDYSVQLDRDRAEFALARAIARLQATGEID